MNTHKLTDSEIDEIRARATEGGLSHAEIAARYGVSRGHVSRLVRGEQRQTFTNRALVLPADSVVVAVRAKLERADIHPADDPVAATALALAEKLDAVRVASTGQAAMAAPGIARAIREALEDLAIEAPDGPRLGRLRGEEARLVAEQLGYPHPEHVDVAVFDRLALLRLQRARRLTGLRDEEYGCEPCSRTRAAATGSTRAD